MINLITGVPGSGKTAYALDFMLRETKEGRKLFVHGIPELKIPHIDVYCSSPNCDVCTHYTEDDKKSMHDALLWHEWAPEGAVLFFDEVQNVYRPRASASKPPSSIQAFEVHRHKGLDFYLISQSPKLFDSNIRELISRHIHLKANWSGRYQYEWPECKTNVQSTSDAIRSSYKLNSKVFALYKSASLHTKQSRKMPVAVYVFAVCFILLGFLSTRIYSRVQDRIAGNSVEVPAISDSPVLDSHFVASSNDHPVVNSSIPILDFKPTIKGVLESAPAYSQVVTVKDFPRISACVSSSSSCTCYTQQATVYPSTLQQCLDFIDGAPSGFNPFIDPQPKERDQQVSKSKSLDT